MAEPELPQIYLITPPEPDFEHFPGILAPVLDAAPVACIRIASALESADADRLGRTADAIREVAHARDIPVLIETHMMMVERHGLDGVHLPDGARSVRRARKALGREAIVGAFCGASRHDGMTAGEAGADYIAFGPVGETGLGEARRAERELFEWWSEMIELPVVAEGGLTEALVRELAPVTDFFAFGPEIWSAESPAAQLAAFAEAIRASAAG